MVAAFLALSCWTIAKGMTFLVHTDELYFWLTTYQHGFVRRGLVGTLLMPWLGNVDIGQIHMVAAACCLLSLCSTIGLATVILWHGLKSQNCLGACTVAALLATSPFLGLVAHHIGYPDGIIATLLLAAAALLPFAPVLTTALILFACCAVHEMAFLLLSPVIVFAMAVTARRRLELAIIAVAILLAVCMTLVRGSEDSGLVGRVVAAGVPLAEAQGQVDVSLHQTGMQALTKMARLWRQYPVNGLLGALYGALPGLCIMLIGAPAVRLLIVTRTADRRHQIVLTGLYGIACVGGVALLTVAWDLARIASFTTLTSFITVMLVMRYARVPPRREVVSLSAVVALTFAVLPVFSVYFDYGRALNLNLVAHVCAPCAASGRTAIDTFNRGHSPATRQKLDTDPLYGDSGD